MPSDPADPKPSTRLYEPEPKSGGGGGIFLVILLLLVLGGGGAYYFLVYKPAAATAPASTLPAGMVPPAGATPTPTANSSSVVPGNPTYNGTQRQQYITQARDSFKALRQGKLQPFSDAFAEFTTAGGFTAASLPSKDAIAARRAIVAKCIATNSDYAAFVKEQEAAYSAELKKTPLVPNDVEVETSYAFAKTPTEKILQLKALQGDSLKTADSILALLDSTFGSWSVTADKHLLFKKKEDMNAFATMAKNYNEQVAALNKLLAEVNSNGADPTGVETTGTSSPAASAAPSASDAPSPTH